jgi:hypothetical protein
MKTLALAAADLVVLIHLLWIVFLIFGALPGRRWVWVKWTHLGSLAFSVLLQLFGWVCPITYLEAWLRTAGGAQPYEGTFIRHYLESVVYATLPANAIFIGTLVVIGVSLWLYFGRRHR